MPLKRGSHTCEIKAKISDLPIKKQKQEFLAFHED